MSIQKIKNIITIWVSKNNMNIQKIKNIIKHYKAQTSKNTQLSSAGGKNSI